MSQGKGHEHGSALLPAYLVAAVTLLLHQLTNGDYGFFRDELYFIVCGQRPAWGYVDQPPLTPILAAVSAAVFGDSPALFRLPAALAHAATVALTGGFSAWLGAGRFGVTVAALTAAVAPVFLVGGHLLTMNAFEPPLWLGCAWLVAAQLRQPQGRRWIWLGLLVGLGLLNKHSMAFLAVALLAGLLASPSRTLLATRGPWIAAAIALGLVAPHLIWQVSQGLPMLELLRNGQLYKNAPFELGAFAGQVVLALHPLTTPLWAAGVWFFFSREGARLRPLGWAVVILMVAMPALKAKFYYLAPVFPIALAAGAWKLEQWLRRWPRARWSVCAVLVAAGAVTAPLAIPVLSPEQLIAYQRALGFAPPKLERHQYRELPQHFADQFGWRELAAEVAAIAEALPAGERVAVFTQNYGQASAIELFGRPLGAPPAISGHNNYHLWGPGAAETLIVVGGDVEDHQEACGTVRQVATVRHHPYVMPYEDRLPLFVCTGLRRPLTALWPALRHYE